MLVKIGDKICDSDVEPIMIVLEEHEKLDIAYMKNEDYKYACFPEQYSEFQMLEFMNIKTKQEKE